MKMKKLILASIAVSLIAVLPARANHGRVTSGVIGFVAGAIVADTYHRHYDRPVYIERQPVYIERQPVGHYEIRYERVWIPGRQIIVENQYGDRTIRYEPGYYVMREIRIWVEE